MRINLRKHAKAGTPSFARKHPVLRRLGALLASIGLMSTFAVTLVATVNADAGNPILGSITEHSVFNADGSVTVYVKGEWNWLSHTTDCNFDRAAAGVGIIWNDPTETGYTVAGGKGGVTAQVGIASKNGAWADPNALDPMVHPADLGNVPEGYTAAGTDYPAGQAFNNPGSNSPADFASWKGGCGREPTTATASKAGGTTCGDGTADCSGHPWGSWGYDVNGGLGYSHTFRNVSDITTVCANFYDVHGGGNAGTNKFQAVNNANEITVNANGDNSIQTNAFNVANGANCITVTPPKLVAKKVVDKQTANPGDTLTYTITVQNTIGSPVTGVNITDDISPVVPTFGTFGTSTPAATVTGGNQLSWPNQTIAGNSTATYTYTVVLNNSGFPNGTTTLPNVVVVTDSNCVAGANDPNCKTTTTVTPAPHLTVTKIPDAQTVVAGSPVGFTIKVTSDGQSTANAVTLADTLPTLANAGINWANLPAYVGPGTCGIAGGAPNQSLNCAFGNLAPGASASVHVTSNTTAPGAGVSLAACAITTQTYATNLDNVVNIASTNATSATANAGICVTGTPHVTVTKTADAGQVTAGNPIGFTIKVTSDGVGTANNVQLNDPLPTTPNVGINWNITPAYTGPGTCGINGAPPTETLVCSFGNMASGTSATIHVTSATSTPPAGSSIAACVNGVANFVTNLDNTATITSAAGGGSASAGICLSASPHVTVTKTADANSVTAGNPVGFTITVTSDGVGTANNVTLADALPTLANVGISWAISPAYTGPGTCGINGAVPTQNLACSFGNMASGATASVHVSSNTTAPGNGLTIAACAITIQNFATNLNNTATVTSSAGGGSASAGTCVSGNPHITVVKTPDAQSVVAGNPVGFTMTVTSDGVGTANNVNLSDVLPTLANAGINWSINPAVAGCTISGVAPTQTLNCSFGNLVSGASASVHVTSNTTTPPAGTTIGLCTVTVATFATNLNNQVQVTSSNAASSIAQTGTCVQNPPHITVVKTPDAQAVVAGNPVGFTMTVTSDGTGTANNVTLSDPLPTLANTGITWSINPAVVGCSISGVAPTQTLNCLFGNLAQGVSVSVHVSSPTTAPAPGIVITPCTISVTTFSTNLNNQVQVTSSNAASSIAQTGVCVTNTPHLTVVKTPDAQSVVAGNAVGFSITVTSDGTGTATNVTLSDALPTISGLGINWSISPAYAGQGTCSITGAVPTQVLSCTIGNLAQGASATVHVTSGTTAPPAGVTIPVCAITITNFQTNLNNSVTATSSTAGTATSQTGVCVTGTPHTTVTKVPDAPTVLAGNPVGFTMVVTSDGIGTANGVTLTDALPTLANANINWSISPAYTGQGTCAITGAAPSQTLGCNIGNLAQGASVSVHVTSQTTAPAPGSTLVGCVITSTSYATNLNNLVQVTSSNAISSTAQTGVCITSNPHISVVKTPDAATVLAGNPVGFTISVKSDGMGTATSVTLSDALPTLANANINWSISPAYAGQGTCAITGVAPSQTLSCSFGDMAQGAAVSVHLTSATTAPVGNTTLAPCQVSVTNYATNLNNSVQVTSATGGSATSQTGICVSINADPSIHIVKVATPTLLPVGGGLVVYTYTVTNTGNVPLTTVFVVDNKCSPVVFVGGDTNNNAALDLTETWTYTCTANITVTTVNTATADGHYIDPSGVDHLVTAQAQATVVVPTPTPTPTGSVKGATSPPKPHVTLPPTDELGSTGDTGNSSGTLMILILLAGIMAAVPVLIFGKRREQDR